MKQVPFVYDINVQKILSNILSPLEEKIPVFGRKKRVIVIAGPTGSGKSELGVELSKILGGEVLSADSCQVYQGMDIGTAKLTPQEMGGIPHHLIDIRKIDEPFNVMEFYEEATRKLSEVSARGHVPILVGGSGFYLHVLLYGPPKGPASNPQVRKKIEEQMDRLGVEVLYERLQMLDPEYAKTVTERDKHKIVRALEIITLSRRKVSDFPKPKAIENSEYDFRCFFLYYPLPILYLKIEKRCDQMIEKGFIEEVKRLQYNGISKNPLASQAIGYKQCLYYLHSEQKEEDLQIFLQEFKRASRNYAKRQFTWFRKEPFFRFLNLDELGIDRVKEIVLSDFEQGY